MFMKEPNTQKSNLPNNADNIQYAGNFLSSVLLMSFWIDKFSGHTCITMQSKIKKTCTVFLYFILKTN